MEIILFYVIAFVAVVALLVLVAWTLVCHKLMSSLALTMAKEQRQHAKERNDLLDRIHYLSTGRTYPKAEMDNPVSEEEALEEIDPDWKEY